MSDTATSTRQLTTAMANGDANAITRYYDAYFDLMFAEARRASGRDEQFCLDIVQDTMLKVIRFVRPMETDSQLAAWTRRVVSNAACDLLRAEIRRRKREVSAARYVLDEEAPDLDELEARVARLSAELKEINAGEKRLLSARYELGWTLRQIGREFGISASAVDGRLRRLARRLRRKCEKSENEQ